MMGGKAMKAGSIRGRPGTVHRQLAGLALLASAAGLSIVADRAAGQEAGGDTPEDRLAHALIQGIPDGERIALHPLWGESRDIPEEDAKPIYDRILEAIYRASEGRHEVFGRNQREDIWADWQREQGNSDYRTFWESRRVSVVVRCGDRPLDRGVRLSCAAVSIGDRSRGDVPASEIFPVSRTAFRIDYALNALSHRLAERLFARLGEQWPEQVADAYILDRDIGQRSRLTEFLERSLRAGINRKIDARRRRLEREARGRDVLQSEEERPVRSPGSGYTLRGDVQRWGGSTMRIDARLTGGGGELSGVSGWEIQSAWLPPEMVPEPGARRFRTEARAEISDRLDREGAVRAMRNLARARVVARALGTPPPPIDVIRSEADGVRALTGTLDHGIPVDERFSDPWPDGPDGLKAELDARVVKIGVTVRPRVRASLKKKELRAREPIRIKLSSEEAVHVAVFGWGADNRIIRLYPNRAVPDLTLEAGGSVILPRAGEGYIWSAPMPGNAEDHETFIVLAAGERLAFEGLTRQAGDSVEKTIQAGVPATSFFAALAKLDTSRLALIVLPYRVTR